jgi:hypothetical protein
VGSVGIAVFLATAAMLTAIVTPMAQASDIAAARIGSRQGRPTSSH